MIKIINTAMCYMKVVNIVYPKSSHHKKKFFFFSIYLVPILDDILDECSLNLLW